MIGSISLRSDVKRPYWIVNWPHNNKTFKISRVPGSDMVMYQTNPDESVDMGYIAAMGLLGAMRNDNKFHIYKYFHRFSSTSSKHHLCKSSTYRTWECMLQRCRDKNHKSYKYYGGRDITVCRRWLKFNNFYIDMGDRPDGKTLDRVNNDLGYCKSNCRWATKEEQANNKREKKNVGHLRGTSTAGESKE